MKRVAIYIRVSTSKQDADNLRRELEAVADRSVVDTRMLASAGPRAGIDVQGLMP